jgi:Kef-type K+ transport system membrane component KefB
VALLIVLYSINVFLTFSLSLLGLCIYWWRELILLGSVLVLLSIFAGVFSARLGAPLLLVFLGLGMLAGEEGLGGIVFRDFHAAYLIGSISLAIILFDGGLRTDPGAIRRALWPSLALATVGVIATAAIVGAAAVLLFSTSWTRGLLIGAIVAPTDAAAVSALLHLRGLELRARVAGTLELESGINDPISVLLAVLLVDLLLAPAPVAGSHIAALLAREVAGGAAFGRRRLPAACSHQSPGSDVRVVSHSGSRRCYRPLRRCPDGWRKRVSGRLSGGSDPRQSPPSRDSGHQSGV